MRAPPLLERRGVQALLDYLERTTPALPKGAEKGEPRYHKGRHLCGEVDGLGARAIASYLGSLARLPPDALGGLKVEKWGYSKCTTWRVAKVALPERAGGANSAPHG